MTPTTTTYAELAKATYETADAIREGRFPETSPDVLSRAGQVVEQAEKMREAIHDAGFSLMETSGKWSIHDVSKKGEAEAAKTLEVATRSVELEEENRKMREGILALRKTMESNVFACCGDKAAEQFCESYGCGTLLGFMHDIDLLAPLSPAENPPAPDAAKMAGPVWPNDGSHGEFVGTIKAKHDEDDRDRVSFDVYVNDDVAHFVYGPKAKRFSNMLEDVRRYARESYKQYGTWPGFSAALKLVNQHRAAKAGEAGK